MMKNILCKLGFHKSDKYRFIRVNCRNGKHKWHKNYAVCIRCGKRLARLSIGKWR